MEKSTIIGLVAGVISVFVGMVIKGAPLESLANPAAFLIIIGGTVACLFNAFTMEQMSKVPTLFKLLMRGNDEQSKSELVKTFVELSQLARREGILALESRVEEIQDPFFRNGLSMVIDCMDPEFVGDVLDAELTIMEQRHAEMRSIFSQAGTYARRPKRHERHRQTYSRNRRGIRRNNFGYLHRLRPLAPLRQQTQN